MKKLREIRRNICYFLIVTILVLNVIDSAFTSFFVFSYGVGIEANPLMYSFISELGLVNFNLIKCGLGSIALLYAWFLVEKTVSRRILSLAVVGFIIVFLYYVCLVLLALMQLP